MICDYTEAIGEETTGDTVNNWFQARSIHHFYNDSNDVNEQEAPYPNVNYRYYFQDDDDCGVKNLLDFNNSTTWCL